MPEMEIVTCHYKEDLRWLESSPYPVNVVGKEGGDTVLLDPSKFKSVEIIPNFGLEASSYLWYIIENYGNLPERMAFIHGHENSPHQRIPIFESIEKYGLHSSFVDLNRCMNEYMILVPKSPFCILWERIMQADFGPVPKIINFRGMAQFSIHRECIRYRPKWMYEKLLNIMLEISKISESDYERHFLPKWIGYFFEAFWHVIFGLDSPIEDKPRINIQSDSSTIYLDTGRVLVDCSGDVLGDYINVFMDSTLKVYKGPWEFMQALAKL